jgi:hypothetical protein
MLRGALAEAAAAAGEQDALLGQEIGLKHGKLAPLDLVECPHHTVSEMNSPSSRFGHSAAAQSGRTVFSIPERTIQRENGMTLWPAPVLRG